MVRWAAHPEIIGQWFALGQFFCDFPKFAITNESHCPKTSKKSEFGMDLKLHKYRTFGFKWRPIFWWSKMRSKWDHRYILLTKWWQCPSDSIRILGILWAIDHVFFLRQDRLYISTSTHSVEWINAYIMSYTWWAYIGQICNIESLWGVRVVAFEL